MITQLKIYAAERKFPVLYAFGVNRQDHNFIIDILIAEKDNHLKMVSHFNRMLKRNINDDHNTIYYFQLMRYKGKVEELSKYICQTRSSKKNLYKGLKYDC